MQTVQSTSKYGGSKTVFELHRNKITERLNEGGMWAYIARRKDVKAALLSLNSPDKTELTFYLTSMEEDSYTHDVEKLSNGRLMVGCQIFSAYAVRNLKKWAGVK